MMRPVVSYFHMRPNFIIGASRILDFGRAMNKLPGRHDPVEHDTLSLFSDWAVVGDDIRNGIKSFDGTSF